MCAFYTPIIFTVLQTHNYETYSCCYYLLSGNSNRRSSAGCRQLVKALDTFCDVFVATLNTVPVASPNARVDNVYIRYFTYSPIFDFLSKSSWGFSPEFTLWFVRNLYKFDHVYFRSYWNYISLFGILYCIISRKNYSISSSGKFTSHALSHSAFKKFLLLLTYLSSVIRLSSIMQVVMSSAKLLYIAKNFRVH